MIERRTDHRSSGRATSLDSGGWVLLSLAVLLYFAWVPAGTPAAWTSEQASGYYDSYVDAVLAGQAHLPVAVAPELVALADPYDPVANAPYRINDLSYHEGRYYLYLGITPVLVLLAPFKAVTGLYLTERAATVVFCSIGVAALFAILRIWHRHLAPRAPAWCVTMAAAGLATSGGYHAVIRTAGSNQIPIASAFALASLGLALSLRFVIVPRSRLRWLVAGSACFGLAIGARPNFAIGAICLLAIPLFCWWRDRDSAVRAIWLRPLLAVGFPVTLAVAAILGWNQLRFGHPLEFGQRLMLGAWDQRTLANSSLTSVWVNLGHYLLGPASYHAHFPFVRPPSWQAIGLLIHVPLLWVGAIAVCVARHPPVPARRSAFVVTALLAGTNLLILILLPSGNAEAVRTSANSRYVLDFQPYCVLLAAFAIVSAGHALVDRRIQRRWLAVLTSGALVAGTIAAVSIDLSRVTASSYRRLAELFNVPTWIVQQVRGVAYGAVNLRVQFPNGQAGATEALLSAGTAENQTVVYVTYQDEGHLRFGLFNTLLGGPESRSIPVDFTREHQIEVSIGALYPPLGAADYAGVSTARVTALLRRVELRLDGEPVLTTVARVDPADPDSLELGSATPWSVPAARAFTGSLADGGRSPLRRHLPPDQTDDHPGPVRIRLRFPQDRTGAQEPLVVSGVPQAGNFVYVRYVDGNHIQLGFDHWGTAGVVSPVLAIDYGATHLIEVDHDGLLPESESRARNRVSIRFNGEEVLAASRGSYASDAADVTIGINSIGGSTCGYLFTGEIIAVERLPLVGP